MKTFYRCSIPHCSQIFDTESDCKAHEKIHYSTVSKWKNYELADLLQKIANKAYNDHIDDKVIGIPIDYFEHLLTEAAVRLKGDLN